MKLKKQVGILFAVVLMAFVLVACGGKKGGDKADSNELNVWAWDASYNVAMIKDAVAAYNKKEGTDYKLNIQDMPSSEVKQKLQTILSSGSGKGLPDIVLMQDADAQSFLSTYSASFADMSAEVNLDKFYDFKKAAVQFDGKTYGVPFDTGVAGLFYRTDLFAEAGFKKEDLQNITWNKFMEIGEKVSAKTGVAYYADDFYTETRLEQIMLQSANSGFNDKDGNPTIVGNPVFKETLETIKKLKSSDNVKNVNGWDNYLKVTNSSDTASVVIGSWYMATIMAAEDQSGKWGVAPIPALEVNGATNYSNTGGASWFVMDNSAKKSEAIKMLNEMFGNDTEFQQSLLKNNKSLVAAKDAATGEAFSEKIEFFGGQEVYKDLASWMNNVPTFYQTKNTPTISDTLKENLKNIIDGKVSIEDGMKEVQASVENKLQ